MSPTTSGPDASQFTADERTQFRKLASSLRVSGIAQLVCSACLAVLAFMGYDTPEKVNGDLLMLAVIFFVVGGALTATGASLGKAMSGDRLALADGLRKLANVHGTIMFVFAIGAVGLLVRLALFLTGQQGGQ